MSEWKECKLGEIVDVIDSLHQTPRYSNIGYPMVRVTDIKGGYLKTKNTLKVDKQVYEVFSKKHKPKKGDIVMSRVGSYGISCIVKNDIDFCLGQNTLFLVPKQNPEFLYYFLNSPDAKNQIESKATGTTQKTISLKSIKEIKVCLPSIFLQTAIAEILSSLDDKVELNNKINQELENLAQTLFKQWFIDYEFPNEKGEPYKSSGGEMVESELGEIPKGWGVGTLGDLCSIRNGYAFKSKDFRELGRNSILKIRNVNGSIVDIENTQFVEDSVINAVQEKFKVTSGNILVAMTGAEVGKIGIVPETNKSLWLNQRVGRFIPKIDKSDVFVHTMFNVLNMTSSIRNIAMGSAQPNISSSGVESIRCLIPSADLILNFSESSSEGFILIQKNLNENQQLTNLRDTLLPKLISGELEINELPN